MTEQGKRFWDEIISNKPADYFDAASRPLLAQYCDALAQHVKLVQRRNELDLLKPAGSLERIELVKALIRLNKSIIDQSNSCGFLATKLRLSVQAVVDRKSGVLNEHPPEMDDDDRLFAGRQLDS